MPSIRPLDDLTRETVRDIFAGVERRTLEVPMHDVQLRESGSGDGSVIFEGYASVFGTPTTLYDGTYYQWNEQIDRHAFDAVLAADPDVHFNLSHDMSKVMARTKAPGPMSRLELKTDDHGLKVYARLNPDNRTVQEILPAMRDGVMDQMSFAFSVKAEGIVTETVTEERKTVDTDTIVEVSRLYDVCVCAQGAYPTTEAALRSLLTDGARVPSREVTPADDGARTSEVAEAPDGAPVSPEVERSKQAALAAARVARSRYR